MQASYKFLTCFLFVILSFSSSFGQASSVNFEVRVPSDGMKKDCSIFLSGTFNCWNPHDSSYIMKKSGDNLYSLIVPVFEGKKYEYKYTQGDWSSVEVAVDNSEIKNRRLFTLNGLTIRDTVVKWKSVEAAKLRDTTLKLNADQQKAFAKLKEEMIKNLESKMKNLSGTFNKAIKNMLSDKPDKKLGKRFHKEMVNGINHVLDMAADALWKVSSILTPEQKKAMITELNKPNASEDIFGMVSKMISPK